MKNIFTVITILLLSVFLVSCSANTDTTQQPTSAPISKTTPTLAPTATPTPEPTATPTPEPTATPTPEPTATPTPEPTATPTPEPTATPTPEPTATPTPEPTATPTPEPTATPTPKPTATPTPTVTPTPFVMTVEHGMEKVNKVMNAYNDLLKNLTPYTAALQMDIEKLEFESQYIAKNFKIGTKDNYMATTDSAAYSIICAYYNNYVNNNTGWYSIEDWVREQKNSDSLKYPYYRNLADDGNYDTNDIMMLEAGSVAKFLIDCNSITATNFIETTEYNISGFESAYVMNLNCDGDTNLNAVFDKDGNMLTIRTEVEGDYYKSNLYN